MKKIAFSVWWVKVFRINGNSICITWNSYLCVMLKRNGIFLTLCHSKVRGCLISFLRVTHRLASTVSRTFVKLSHVFFPEFKTVMQCFFLICIFSCRKLGRRIIEVLQNSPTSFDRTLGLHDILKPKSVFWRWYTVQSKMIYLYSILTNQFSLSTLQFFGTGMLMRCWCRTQSMRTCKLKV